MSRRSKSFDKYVAEQMQDLDYARDTLIAAIDHFGDSVEEALRYTIKQMGIKEFSHLSNISVQNISDFIKRKRKPKIKTLDKYLSVFKLKSKVVVVKTEDSI